MAFLRPCGPVSLEDKRQRTESERRASIRIQFDKIMKYGGVCAAEMVGYSAVSISTKRDEISHVQLYPGDLSERRVIDPSPKGRAEISVTSSIQMPRFM